MAQLVHVIKSMLLIVCTLQRQSSSSHFVIHVSVTRLLFNVSVNCDFKPSSKLEREAAMGKQIA